MSTRLRPVARAALVRAKRLAEARPWITGVDWGVQYRDGKRRGRGYGIRFHVAQKRPLEELPPSQVLPRDIDGIACDVLQGHFAPHASRLDEVDPARPGVSIGNLQRQSTGTLGGVVDDDTSGQLCVLSNWHVLCGSTGAEAGDHIIQPGPAHLGVLQPRTIARLLRWTNLDFGVDAAVAQIEPGVAVDRAPFGLPIDIAGIAEPKIGMQLVKSGALSDVTHAIVDAVEGAYPMSYVEFGDVERRFMDAIYLKLDPNNPEDAISRRGDSGSLWIDPATNKAVALHFGGEHGTGPLSEIALAHPLARVLHMLRVKLRTA